MSISVIQYNAVSIDGFIAKSNGDTEWISETDAQVFFPLVRQVGVVIVGRTSFEQYLDVLYPLPDVVNVVMTRQQELVKDESNVLYTNESPSEVLRMIEQKGFSEVLLLGGAKTNASFLQSGLINQVILSIHPVVFGKGLSLYDFGDDKDDFSDEGSLEKQFDLESVVQLSEGVVQGKYEVKYDVY